jgi:phage-related protein
VAEFNAGSIEASLTLNKDAFTRGLEEAKAEADRFATESFTAKLDIDTGDDAEKIALLKAEIDSISGKSVDIGTKSSGSGLSSTKKDLEDVTTGLEDATKAADDAAPAFNAVSESSSSAGGSMGSILGPAIATLVPLLVPVVGEVVGLAGALTTAGAGLGAFGIFAVGALKSVSTAMTTVQQDQQKINTATTDKAREAALAQYKKDIAALPPAIQVVLTSWQNFQKALDNRAVQDSVLGVFNKALTVGAGLLTSLQPLAISVANDLSGVIGQVGAFLQGPAVRGFMTFVQQNFSPVMNSLVGTVESFGAGWLKMTEVAGPAMYAVLDQLGQLGDFFNQMVSGPGFKQFIDNVVSDLPQFTQLLETFFTTLGDILLGLQPAVQPAEGFLTAVGSAIDKLATGGTLTALANAFGLLLDAVTPLLPLLADLLNTVLPPLLTVVGDFFQALAPAIPALVQQLAPVLPKIATSLAAWATAMIPLMPSITQLALILVKDLTPPVLNAFVNFLNQSAIFMTIMAPILIKVVQYLGDLVQWVTDGVHWLEQFATKVHEAQDKLNEFLGKIEDWVKKLQNFFKDAPGWLLNAGEAMIGGLWKGIQTGWHAVDDWFNGMKKRIEGYFTTAVSWLINEGSAIISGLWHGITAAWGGVSNWFSGLGGTIGGLFSGAVGWLLGAGEQIIHGLLNGLTGAWGTVTNWISGLGGTFGALFTGAVGWLVGAGEQIMAGLKNGIVAGFEAVKSFVGGIAGDIISLKGPLDYDRIMLIPHGMAIMAGLNEGLTTGYGNVQRNVAGMGVNIGYGFSGGVASASTGGTTVATAKGPAVHIQNAYFQDQADVTTLMNQADFYIQQGRLAG